ncbi:hypothetical protein [Bacillus coahuilensis]|uniref:hypothetical protein n=1 Tax=Bacillus coahuilensis TaxID=408580 RepID=UPI00187C21C6|nr:hypothetical protein [Bacillus coahuilensis]
MIQRRRKLPLNDEDCKLAACGLFFYPFLFGLIVEMIASHILHSLQLPIPSTSSIVFIL